MARERGTARTIARLAGLVWLLQSTAVLAAEGNAPPDPGSLLPFAPDREYSVEELQAQMPRIGAVPGVDLKWVARRMSNNGLPMGIQQLESQRPLDEVIAAYKRRFRKLGVLAPHERRRPRFAELFGGLGPYFVRLQVGQRDGRTTGYLSVIAQPRTVESSSESDFPLPESIEIESRMAYGEGGSKTETLMGYSDSLPGIVVNDFRRALEAAGWEREQIMSGDTSGPSNRTRANLRYANNGHQAQILVVHRPRGQNGRSVVMVHWRKRP